MSWWNYPTDAGLSQALSRVDPGGGRRRFPAPSVGIKSVNYTVSPRPRHYSAFDNEVCHRHYSSMKPCDAWTRRTQGRLERAGFKVGSVDLGQYQGQTHGGIFTGSYGRPSRNTRITRSGPQRSAAPPLLDPYRAFVPRLDQALRAFPPNTLPGGFGRRGEEDRGLSERPGRAGGRWPPRPKTRP